MNYKKKSIRDVSFQGKKDPAPGGLQRTAGQDHPRDHQRQAHPGGSAHHRVPAQRRAALVVCSHLGKPKKDPDAKTNLDAGAVAVRFSQLLGRPVEFAHDTIGPDSQGQGRRR